jgi:DNA-binding response OmpR family regulator
MHSEPRQRACSVLVACAGGNEALRGVLRKEAAAMATNLIEVDTLEEASEALDAIDPSGLLCFALTSSHGGLGPALIREIRSHALQSNTPVVMIVPDDDDAHAVPVLGEGANAYIRDPEETVELHETISDLLHFWISANLIPSANQRRHHLGT